MVKFPFSSFLGIQRVIFFFKVADVYFMNRLAQTACAGLAWSSTRCFRRGPRDASGEAGLGRNSDVQQELGSVH